jgi:hypothetical protein
MGFAALNLSYVLFYRHSGARSQRVRAKRGPMTGSASEPGIQTHGTVCLDSGFAHSAVLNERPEMTACPKPR